MDRRRSSLVLLLAFVACTVIAIVVSGGRPGLQQGIAPTVAQFLGYLLALVAALLLLLPPAAGAGTRHRWAGAAVLGGLVVLLAVEMGSEGGTDIGAGVVRLVGLVVIGVATARLAQDVAAARRTR